LTADQKDQLAKLQSDVDQRLASILTEQQKQQIEEHHRRGPHSEGERRTRPNRPQ
jgi:Spy/CpxP family protein refolding chaperone